MRVLLITQYYAPVNAVASIRWTKLVKYLSRDYGYDVDVVTNEKNYEGRRPHLFQAKYDVTLEGDASFSRSITEIKTPFCASLCNTTWWLARKAKFLLAPIAKRLRSGKSSSDNGENSLASPLSASSLGLADLWDRAMCHARLPRSIDIRSYDVLISSFGPKWVHALAREVKRLNPGIVWIADYRDYVASGIFGDTPDNRAFASTVTKEADCIVSVGVDDAVRDGLYLDPGQRLELIPNGFDGEEERPSRDCRQDVFIVSYTGTLYSWGECIRDLRPIFRALSKLVEDGIAATEEIKFVYAGPTSDLFSNQISTLNLIRFEDKGMLSRNEALSLQSESALLAFCTWNTAKSTNVLTAKIFEYFVSGVPIIGVCSGDVPNSKSREMIHRSKLGYCFEECRGKDDFDSMYGFLKTKYMEWKRDGTTRGDPDRDYIETFSYKSRAKQVDEVISNLFFDKEGAKDENE